MTLSDSKKGSFYRFMYYRTGYRHHITSRQQRTIWLHGLYGRPFRLEYTLQRSARTTFGITIAPGGTVTVHIPERVSTQDAECYIRSQSEWILEHLEHARRIADENPYMQLSKEEREQLRKETAHKLRLVLPVKIRQYQQFLPVSRRPVTRITIREQKTRWGSCSQKGTLSFNWKIGLFPESVMNYVIVHEVCHLCEMNHGSRFWALVASIDPDYKDAQKWLRENGAAMIMF